MQKTRDSRLATRHSPPRGILLLVVLSMLTLFLLIGTAFIVSSNHYRNTLKTFAKATEASNSSIDQGNLLDEVINQLVRDTNNQNSSLRFHSLLRDMYGNDGILAEIQSADWAGADQTLTGGQMLQFQLDPTTLANQFGIKFSTSGEQLSQLDNAYNGLVLTFLDGLARGQSTRITGFLAIKSGPPPITVPVFRVMAPRKADGSNIIAADLTKLNGSRILINGRPFNGTGTGYDPTNTAANSAKLSTTELVAGLNPELSLVPNTAFFNHLQFNTNGPGTFEAYFGKTIAQWGALSLQYQQRLINGMGLVGLGGSDESYDAVDFQNMLLASMQTHAVETVLPDITVSGYPPSLGQMVIPSNQRPALLRYWKQQLLGGTTELEDEPNLLRKVLLRPNWLDHPNFTGSNPDFANLGNNEDRLRRMIYGPWDVDNDQNGIRDSVWVDFGAPVMENSDGRLVKPLAAILVLDMDGRLNINAHGSQDIANATNYGVSIAGTGNTTDLLPQGQGYGPAEISLEPLMPAVTRVDRRHWYRRFFEGADANTSLDAVDAANAIALQPKDRRFRRRTVGKFGRRPNPGNPNSIPLPGIDDLAIFDLSAQLKMQGVPRWADGSLINSSSTANPILGGYVTPPDYRGRYALGLNALGQPVYESMLDMGVAGTELDSNTPYELDLSLGAARGDTQTAPDGPYTMAELERVLRAYDPDAGALPSRLWKLAGEFKPSAAATSPNLDMLNLWRTTVTTESYDLPVPSVVVPGWMRLGPNGTSDPPGTTSDDFEDVMGRVAAGVSFVDLLEYRIRLAANPTNPSPPINTPPTPLTLIQRQEIRKLLPQDLADGLRLDINRPLGNGRDDDDNGVVDEPGEDEGSFWVSNNDPGNKLAAFKSNATGQFRDDVLFLREGDVNGDGNVDLSDRTALETLHGINGAIDTFEERVIVHNLRRQMLARDLYVLAMTLIDPLPIPTAGITDPGYLERRAKRAKQLAQWAINVVDFRDPDNIMTAFEYDENPFDGWSADGSAITKDDIYGTDNKIGGLADQGGMVWGAESPELIMTETLAWHDRRTVDTRREGEPSLEETDSHEKADVGPRQKKPDEPFDASQDQRERPQGAAFVELYCPLPANPAANSDTHFIDNAGNDLGINLAAVDRQTGNSPVWRMMVYKKGGPDRRPEDPNANNQPTDLQSKRKADRCVYFSGFDPGDPVINPKWHDDKDGVAFFNEYDERNPIRGSKNKVPPVRPGRYLVVGAGEEINSGEYLAKFGENNSKSSQRGIMLRTDTALKSVELKNSTGVTSMDVAGFAVTSPLDPDDGMFNLSSVAIINRTLAGDRNFNVSEPAGGYPRSLDVKSVKGFSNSAWDENKQQYVPILDIPIDEQRAIANAGGGANNPVRQMNRAFRDGENRLALPLDDRGDRTIPNFSWIYLQRLANPLLPWNPPNRFEDGSRNRTTHDPTLAVNPYMTVDSMGVNVTVFNGLSDSEFSIVGGKHKRYNNNYAMQSFASLQRGRYNSAVDPYKDASPVQAHIELGRKRIPLKDSASTPPPLEVNLYGTERIEAKSYWKNKGGPTGNGNEGAGTSHYFKALPDSTLGFLNEPFRGNSASQVVPFEPFPWLTWNNRPYANAGELIQVPAFNGLDLLHTFSYNNQRGTKLEHYGVRSNGIPSTSTTDPIEDLLKELKVLNPKLTNFLEVDGRFGHLLNFFRTKANPGSNANVTSDDEGTVGLYRVLDYVHVPSPFVKTETWLNPASFGATNVTGVDDPRYLRQPPFNRIAEYREPGRINVNTAMSGEVWDGGILHRELQFPADPWNLSSNNYDPNSGHTGPMFIPNTLNVPGLVSSRRGYGAANASPLLLDADTPTFFENPFRSAAAGKLVPLNDMIQEDVHCTTLRGVPTNTGAPRGTLQPLFASNSPNAYNDADRNPYFRYQPMARLSSMTTTRSNVYAVWVTVGFFEVEEADDWVTDENGVQARFNNNRALYDKVYPEGYTFGKEAGSDTGDLRRVREFAMIDRTVPVAFEPGQNHNVDKAIRLRRRIE